MRIVGGAWRGTALTSLGAGDARAALRPTTDKTRESLFNLLLHGPYPAFDGVHVLDLFAGTGALGLEALSRGAATATFVDKGATAAGLIRRNITATGAAGRATLIRRDATRLGANGAPPAALVLLDPPYGSGLGAPALIAARQGGWIADGATVVWEDAAPAAPPAGFALLDRRRYGGTHLNFLSTLPKSL